MLMKDDADEVRRPLFLLRPTVNFLIPHSAGCRRISLAGEILFFEITMRFIFKCQSSNSQIKIPFHRRRNRRNGNKAPLMVSRRISNESSRLTNIAIENGITTGAAQPPIPVSSVAKIIPVSVRNEVVFFLRSAQQPVNGGLKVVLSACCIIGLTFEMSGLRWT